MGNLDQKVPQNQFLVSDGDIMFSDINSENRFASTVSEMLAREEFAPLEPVPSYGCIPVSEHISDQQVQGSESPKSFMDLDTANGVSLYDECIQIKQEKTEHSDCFYESCEQFQHQNLVIKEEPLNYIFEEVKNEVENVCDILRISHDPKYWSEEDVRKWIVWHGAKFCPNTPITGLFNMNGQQLCKLSVNDFVMRTPSAGSNLFAQLEIWRNACTLLYSEPAAMQQTTDYRYQIDSYRDDFAGREPSMSPSPSLSSEDSVSSLNSPHCITQVSSDDEFPSFQKSSENVLPTSTEHKQTIHLWQFLKELLLQPQSYGTFIKWVDRHEGIFKIEDSARVAKLWGRRKNRPAMNYDKLSRSIRQYYKKGIIKKTTHSKRLVYQFCQPYL